MNSLIDTLCFLRGIETAEKPLNDNPNIKLRDLRDLVNNQFEKY